MKKDLGVLPAVFPMPVLMVGKTLANIRERKAFTVALADEAHIKEADFFGIATGNKMPDKFERTGFHAEKSKNVDAPIISEFALTMECDLLEAREMFGEIRVGGSYSIIQANKQEPLFFY